MKNGDFKGEERKTQWYKNSKRNNGIGRTKLDWRTGGQGRGKNMGIDNNPKDFLNKSYEKLVM